MVIGVGCRSGNLIRDHSELFWAELDGMAWGSDGIPFGT